MLRSPLVGSLLAAAVVLAGCTATDAPPVDAPPVDAAPAPAPSGTDEAAEPVEPSPSPTPAREPAPAPDALPIAFEVVVDGLGELTGAYGPAGDERVFVVTKGGEILIVDGDGALLDAPFLDLTGEVVTGAEQGLLSLAFVPGFPEDPRAIVSYTEVENGDTRIIEYQLDPADPNRLDPASARTIFALEQPHRWHNGGHVMFGPDGYLWVSLGDGGPGEDPAGRGQDPMDLYGSILRVDLDGGDPYGIPADNPFADGVDGAPEVWLYGLRNPWRFDVDGIGEQVYVGDVGQYLYEEVSAVAFADAGANLGWAVREGTHCFKAEECDTTGLVEPVVDYVHADGRCAVAGGVVYRGEALPELWGHYLYTDVCAGFLKSFLLVDGAATDERDWTESTGRLPSPVAFGLDGHGEVLLAGVEGSVVRLIRSDTP